MPILSCEELTVQYGSQLALDHLTFSVEAGDYLCIVGENGSGKTTLMKTLLGLQSPQSGSIHYHGITARNIGYLPQQLAIQKDFPASVREVVYSGGLSGNGFLPYYTKAQRLRAEEMLDRVHSLDLLHRSYRTLSGGQQQRVLLARALTAADRLLLLDEPAAALDPTASAELYALIDSLHREGITILMVSHDLTAALRATKVLQMATRAEFFGSTAAYRESAAYHRLAGGAHHG